MAHTDLRLLPSQKANVADALEAAGFRPSEFAWADVTDPDMTVSKLTHLSTGFFFQFHVLLGREQSHYAIFSPASDLRMTERLTGSWYQQMKAVTEWAAVLRREIDTPDPDARFFSASNLIQEGEARNADNTPFSEPEYRDTVRRLESIRSFLIARADTDEEAAAVTNAKIDHLIAEAKSQGRRDWFFLAMGTLLSEIVGRALDSDEVRHVFELLVRGVQQIGGG